MRVDPSANRFAVYPHSGIKCHLGTSLCTDHKEFGVSNVEWTHDSASSASRLRLTVAVK